uniref:Uncharacterized protein n=1 Tax=Meloidogyne enterolobii TaxID=390850 RepID=A0A6V7VR57_MELEN|nr:unnamed protein product [Meloidogyne enterolobii]
MAQCYVDADYQKAKIPGDGITEMEEVLEPHYTFGNYINGCIKIKELLANNFASSGLDEWIVEMKKELKEKYDSKIRSFAKIGISERIDISEFDRENEAKFYYWKQNSEERLKEIFVEKNYLEFKKWLEGKTKKENKKFERISGSDSKSSEDESKELKDTESERVLSNSNENLKIIFVKENLEKYNFWLKNLEKNPETLKKIYIKEIELAFNYWRRRTNHFGIFLKAAYLKFAKVFIDKLKNAVSNIQNKKLFRALTSISHRMKIEIFGNIAFGKYFFKKDKSHFDSFYKALNEMEKYLEKIKVNIKKPFVFKKKNVPKFPKVNKVIWVVRHSERLDNDEEERNKAEGDECFNYNGRKFMLDNSPLSDEGKLKASRLNKVFANIPIKEIFVSPYERTIETALYLLGYNKIEKDSIKKENNKIKVKTISKEIKNNDLKIKLEPGFIEKLSQCGDNSTGYEECKELAKHHKGLNCEYKPIFTREKAESFKEIENRRWDIACIPRLKEVFTQLLKNNAGKTKLIEKSKKEEMNEWLSPGEENAEHIVIVSHGMVISSLEQMISGRYTNVPQASIMKIVELEEEKKDQKKQEKSNIDENGKLKNLRMIFSNVTTHLNEKGRLGYYGMVISSLLSKNVKKLFKCF